MTYFVEWWCVRRSTSSSMVVPSTRITGQGQYSFRSSSVSPSLNLVDLTHFSSRIDSVRPTFRLSLLTSSRNTSFFTCRTMKVTLEYWRTSTQLPQTCRCSLQDKPWRMSSKFFWLFFQQGDTLLSNEKTSSGVQLRLMKQLTLAYLSL